MGRRINSGIYKIQSKIKPERIYVGSALLLTTRWATHKNELLKGKHDNPRLQNHVNKYGINDLEFSVIELCFKWALIAREQYYIDSMNPFFNIAKIAGSTLGVKMGPPSEERRKYQSEILKGRKRPPFTAEHRMNLSLAKRGKKWSEETRSKTMYQRSLVPHPCLGKVMSAETKKKISETKKRRNFERSFNNNPL